MSEAEFKRVTKTAETVMACSGAAIGLAIDAAIWMTTLGAEPIRLAFALVGAEVARREIKHKHQEWLLDQQRKDPVRFEQGIVELKSPSYYEGMAPTAIATTVLATALPATVLFTHLGQRTGRSIARVAQAMVASF